MVALQISSKIESLYGLGRQATKFQGFVWNFATFVRLSFGQFSAEKLGWVAFHSVGSLSTRDFETRTATGRENFVR